MTQTRHEMFYKRYSPRTWSLRDLADAYIRLRKSRDDERQWGHKDYFARDFLDYETQLVDALETALGVTIETVRVHTSPATAKVYTYYEGFDGRTSRGRDLTTLIDYLNRVEQLPFGVVLEGSISREQMEWENRLARPARELGKTVRAMIYELVEAQYPDAVEQTVDDEQLAAAGLDPREVLEPDPVMFM